MSLAEDIANARSTAFRLANLANEKRYQDILSGYAARAGSFNKGAKQIYGGYNDLIARQQLIGDSDRNTDLDQYRRNLGDTKGILSGHGMGAAFMMANAERGAASDYGRQENLTRDRLAREYASVFGNRLNFQERTNLSRSGITKEQLDFMERKQDLGPQAGLYEELAGLAGKADAGIAGFTQGGGGVNLGGGGTRGTNPAVPGFTPPIDQNSILNGLNPDTARQINNNAKNTYNQTIYPAELNAAAMGASMQLMQGMGPNFGSLFGNGGGGMGIPAGGNPAIGGNQLQMGGMNNNGFNMGGGGWGQGWQATPQNAYNPFGDPSQGNPYSQGQFNQGFPGSTPGFFSAPGYYGGPQSGYPISPDMGSYWGGGGGYDAFGSYGYS